MSNQLREAIEKVRENYDDACNELLSSALLRPTIRRLLLAFTDLYEAALADSAVESLGFNDLLRVAELLLEKYPKDTVLSSEHWTADVGARFTDALRKWVSRCRAAAPGEVIAATTEGYCTCRECGRDQCPIHAAPEGLLDGAHAVGFRDGVLKERERAATKVLDHE